MKYLHKITLLFNTVKFLKQIQDQKIDDSLYTQYQKIGV